MVKYIFTLLIVFSVIMPANSQIMNNKGGQVLLKGVVRDDITGGPVSVNIEFKSNSGNKIKVVSNSIDGVYEQILRAGESYEVLLSNFDILRKVEKVQIMNTTQYQEQSQDFTVTRLSPGLQLYKISAFDKSSHKMTNEAEKTLSDLQELMKFNRNVKFELTISGDYQTSKQQVNINSKNKKDKKAKAATTTKNKKNKKDTPALESAKGKGKQSSDKVHSLVDSRIKEIQTLINSWPRSKEKISYKPDYDFTTPNSTNFNLIITVVSVEQNFK
jgi:hypothetical protein